MEVDVVQFLERFARLLDSYSGRDKAIRASYFLLILWASRMRERRKAEFMVFARQLSRTRLVCRLFSQPSLLRSALRIPEDWRKSTDRVDTALNSSINSLYLLCGWVEFFGLLAEANLIGKTKQAAIWFQYSLRLWIFALIFTLSRSIRQIFLRLKSSQSPQNFPLKWIRQQLIGLAGTAADFVAASNSLPPPGLFWGKKFNETQSAALFLLSSIIGVYRLW